MSSHNQSKIASVPKLRLTHSYKNRCEEIQFVCYIFCTREAKKCSTCEEYIFSCVAIYFPLSRLYHLFYTRFLLFCKTLGVNLESDINFTNLCFYI